MPSRPLPDDFPHCLLAPHNHNCTSCTLLDLYVLLGLLSELDNVKFLCFAARLS
jgi:hypothetical protein